MSTSSSSKRTASSWPAHTSPSSSNKAGELASTWVLGSQRFAVKGMSHRDAIFAQLQLRMSLALTDEDRKGLRELGKEARDLLSQCKERGEVLINDAGGADGGNRLGRVAFCPESQRGLLLDSLVKRSSESGITGPLTRVLDGSDRPRFSDVPIVRALLRKATPATDGWWEQRASRPERHGGLATRDWIAEDKPTPLWLGAKKALHGHATVVLRQRSGENLLIAGGEPAQRFDLLEAAVTSLLVRPQDALQLFVLDYSRGPENGRLAPTSPRRPQRPERELAYLTTRRRCHPPLTHMLALQF